MGSFLVTEWRRALKEIQETADRGRVCGVGKERDELFLAVKNRATDALALEGPKGTSDGDLLVEHLYGTVYGAGPSKGTTPAGLVQRVQELERHANTADQRYASIKSTLEAFSKVFEAIKKFALT